LFLRLEHFERLEHFVTFVSFAVKKGFVMPNPLNAEPLVPGLYPERSRSAFRDEIPVFFKETFSSFVTFVFFAVKYSFLFALCALRFASPCDLCGKIILMGWLRLAALGPSW